FKAATNKADSTRIREQIIKTDKALRDYQENIIKTKPQSLLATLFSAMKRPTPPAIPVIKGKPDSTYPYYFVKNHYWDG
ncbi:hypothetical protein ABTK20_22760, partial [Acinetobacter baumannii]